MKQDDLQTKIIEVNKKQSVNFPGQFLIINKRIIKVNNQ